MRRNEEIDRLRAFAVLLTIYSHVPDLFLWNIELLTTLQPIVAGWNGVLLFFIISGFVISGTLIPRLESALPSHHLNIIKGFFIRRIYRIWPTAIMWAILAAILGALGADEKLLIGNLYAAIAAILNIFNFYIVFLSTHPNNLGPFWSLSLEEQFYLIFPFFLICIASGKFRSIFLIMIIITVNFIPAKLHGALPIEPIISGVLMFIVGIQWGWIEKLRHIVKPLRKPLLAVAFACILLASCMKSVLTHSGLSSHPIIFNFLNYGILTLIILLATLKMNIIFPLRYGVSIMNWIGSRSFVLYLCHTPAIFLVRFLWLKNIFFNYNPQNNLLILFSWLAATVIFAEISYRFIENPILKKGKVLASRIESKDLAYSIKQRI